MRERRTALGSDGLLASNNRCSSPRRLETSLGDEALLRRAGRRQLNALLDAVVAKGQKVRIRSDKASVLHLRIFTALRCQLCSLKDDMEHLIPWGEQFDIEPRDRRQAQAAVSCAVPEEIRKSRYSCRSAQQGRATKRARNEHVAHPPSELIGRRAREAMKGDTVPASPSMT
jgi:hypothetical protein